MGSQSQTQLSTHKGASSLLCLPACPHVQKNVVVSSPPRSRFLPQTPDLHPELAVALMPMSAHTSPGVDLWSRTTLMTLVWSSWVSRFPLQLPITTSQLLSHPDPPVKPIPCRIAPSPCSHQTVDLCVSGFSGKSSWRETEVGRWKKAEDSRGLTKECFSLIINHEVKNVSHLDVADSLQPQGLQAARLPCPWSYPGKKTGVGYHSLLQGIFPTQGSNLGLLHCRKILYHLNHLESPIKVIYACY